VRIPRYLLFLLIASVACFGAACDDDDDNGSSNAPADHTVSQDGVRHLTGLRDPENNCTACHGENLQGGDTAPSCYSCHDKEW
jgi:hypothetical protein